VTGIVGVSHDGMANSVMETSVCVCGPGIGAVLGANLSVTRRGFVLAIRDGRVPGRGTPPQTL
jgi:hypothetical protein